MAELPVWRRILIFAILLLSEFFYGWAWNSVDVLRPFLRQSLHLGMLQAGSIYSAQGVGALTGAIVMGQLADRFGRRNVLVGLVIGYGALLLCGVAVKSYGQLLAQRFCLGLFMGGVFPVAVGIYVTLFHDRVRGRLAGAMNALFSSSIVVLGLALALTRQHDWRLLLWMGALPPLALAPLVFLFVPNQVTAAPAGVGRRNSWAPIGELFHPALRVQTLMLALMSGLNFFGYQAFSGWSTTYLTSVRGLSL
jgi:MFS family permease